MAYKSFEFNHHNYQANRKMNILPKEYYSELKQLSEKYKISIYDIGQIIGIHQVDINMAEMQYRDCPQKNVFRHQSSDNITKRLTLLYELLQCNSDKVQEFYKNFNAFLNREVAKLFILPSEKTYFVWLDILGFKNIIYNHNFEYLKQIVNNFITKFDIALDISRTFGDEKSEKTAKIEISHDLNFRIFSDSIMIWTNDSSHRVFRHLLDALCKIMQMSFIIKMPLRGVLTYGDLFTVNKMSNHFLTNEAIYGKSLVEAYSLEGKINWAGCIVDSLAWEQIKNNWDSTLTPCSSKSPNCYDFYLLDRPFLTLYKVPWKNYKEGDMQYNEEVITINWMYSTRSDIFDILNENVIKQAFLQDGTEEDLDDDVRQKMQNTLDFYHNQITMDENDRQTPPNNYWLYKKIQ